MAAGIRQGLITDIPEATSALDSHIYFFYDSEGSGGSAIRDQMIEVAVVQMTHNLGLTPVDEKRLRDSHYTSLCQCTSEIELGAWLKHGIRQESLVDQPPVEVVLQELLAWLEDRVREVERLKKKMYKVVLVAHGGIAFDFPLLLTEVKRSGSEAKFRDLDLKFADTYLLCQQLSMNQHPALRGTTKISVHNLENIYFPSHASSPSNTPHRALSDALSLRRLFTETPLSEQTSHLELFPTETILLRWQATVDAHQLSERLGIDKHKAKGLLKQGATLEVLEERFRASGYSELWLRDYLRSTGIKRPGEDCLQYFRELM